MNWYEIAGIALAVILLIFVILSWAGIVPKKITESTPVKRLIGFDVLGIIALAMVGTVMYLAVSEKEIPSMFYVLLPMVIVLVYYSRR